MEARLRLPRLNHIIRRSPHCDRRRFCLCAECYLEHNVDIENRTSHTGQSWIHWWFMQDAPRLLATDGYDGQTPDIDSDQFDSDSIIMGSGSETDEGPFHGLSRLLPTREQREPEEEPSPEGPPPCGPKRLQTQA